MRSDDQLRGFLAPRPKLVLMPGRRFMTEREFRYAPPPELYPGVVYVPAGFISEPSIPRPFWRMLPPIGDYVAAAAIHDWLYVTQRTTRKLADQIMLAAMKDSDVPLWERTMIYSGVRIGGWKAWRDHSKQRSDYSRYS